MSAPENTRLLQCMMPGCVGSRWPNSAVCAGHWRRLTLKERNEMSDALRTIGAAALDGDQKAMDAAIVDCEALLARLAPDMPGREMTPLASEVHRLDR